MSKVTIRGYVPLRMEIKDGLLFCNNAKGCVVKVDGRVVFTTHGPVFNEPIEYELAPGEHFEFEAL